MIAGRSAKWMRRTATRASPRVSRYSWYRTPVPRPMVVATAAPVTPSLGKGPMPKMKQGPSTMLIALANQRTPHRDGGVARAAEDRVDEEQQQHRRTAAQHHPGVTRADGGDGGRGPHDGEEAWRERDPQAGDDGGDAEAQGDSLHSDLGRRVRPFLPDAARDDRRHPDREAHRRRIDQGQHRFRQADGGDGVGTEARHPEHVHHGEDRLHRHFEDHGDREQDDPTAERPGRVVVRNPADGVAHHRPPLARLTLYGGNAFVRHRPLPFGRPRSTKLATSGNGRLPVKRGLAARSSELSIWGSPAKEAAVPARLPPLPSIPAPFLRQILVRSILVWLGVRGAAFLLFGLTVPALPAAGLVVALTVGLTTWDGRRLSEHVFLANLGIPVWVLALAAAVPPLSCELTIRFLA